MKKSMFFKKLALNKKTVVDLSKEDMNASRAGADSTDIGISCYTSRCCLSYDCDEDEAEAAAIK